MKTYDAVIVLGRGISADGSIPESVKAATAKAIELLDRGVAEKVIFSGKWSRHSTFIPPRTEAQAAFEYALSLGLPKEKALLEEESLDTLCNCYYIKKNILIPNAFRSVLLLTMRKNDKRSEFLLKKILGSDYRVDVLSIDFEFPLDTLKLLEEAEARKVIEFQNFLRDVKDGDHETIMQMQLEYVANEELQKRAG